GLGGGEVFRRLVTDMRADCADETRLLCLLKDCEAVAEFLHTALVDDRLAASYPFLTMLAVAVAGWLMKRQLVAVEKHEDAQFRAMKTAAAHFYMDQVVPEAAGLFAAATASADILYQVQPEAFGV
nr:acyl-CoA dehydrogenase C-terminal domain-containing protein [Pseudomonadota bacterium]